MTSFRVALLAGVVVACGKVATSPIEDAGLTVPTPGDAPSTSADSAATCPTPAGLSNYGPCDREGQTCTGEHDCGCGFSPSPVPCTCTDGRWSCEAESCGDCPPGTIICPANPVEGESCTTPATLRCNGMLSCPDGMGGNVELQCMGGTWIAVSKDACGPVKCVAGGPCTEAICRVPGAGPCGSEEVLSCSSGTYVLQSYACTEEGAGCGSVGEGPNGCTTSCTCTNGSEVCTSSGDCDAG